MKIKFLYHILLIKRYVFISGYTISFDFDIHISWFSVIFLSNSFLSLELLKYIGAFQKKVSTPPIYTFGWVCYVILKKNISALTFLVSNSNCLKYLCVLTFLTYRFYFLLNLTILFFYILFLEYLIWLVSSTLCPFKLLFHFSISFVWIYCFKRKACRLLTMALKSAFWIAFLFS